MPHVARGACREGGYRNFRKFTAQILQLAVLGAEVVSPFGDAVRLVNHEE
jgi:hypothetical protein